MAYSLRSFKYLHPPIKGTRLHIKPPHRLNRGDLLRTPLRDHRIKLRPLDRLASAVHAVRLSNRNSLSLAVADVLTLELGQSCVGDRFGWFVDNCVPEAYAVEAREKGISVHKLLRQKTERLAPGESGLVALGSAMYAAAAAGIYPSVKEAAKKLAAPCAVCYIPNEENQAWYSALYREYVTMHDYFGRSGNDVMAQLMQR